MTVFESEKENHYIAVSFADLYRVGAGCQKQWMKKLNGQLIEEMNEYSFIHCKYGSIEATANRRN